jgi:peptidoglycan/xylan/chitin deacetylase (PgdA/CDA1 family)
MGLVIGRAEPARRRRATAVVLALLAVELLGARRIDQLPMESRLPLPHDGARAGAPALEVERTYNRRAPGRRLALERQYPSRMAAGVSPVASAVAGAARGASRHSVAEPAPVAGAIDASGAVVPPLVALTFDTEIPYGVEAHETLSSVLDTLRAAAVRATFFVVGDWARANPGMLRRMAVDGHEIANHSASHTRFAGRSPAELAAELGAVAAIVKRQTGGAVAPFFRPPYGCIDAAAATVVRAHGYRLTGWTASGQDARSSTRSPDHVVRAVATHLGPAAVVLLHTHRSVTATALPAILQLVADRGLTFAPLSTLVDTHPPTAARLDARVVRPCGLVFAEAGRPAL